MSIEKLLNRAINFSNFNNLIHVGAHEGQEISLYQHYNLKNIYLVEPLPECVEILKKKIIGNPNITLLDFALGSQNEFMEIYIADGNYSASTSLLKPRKSKITFSRTEKIEVKKFSSLGISNVDIAVIDTQGFEIEVLRGFEELIYDLNFAIVEFANYEGYINQPTYRHLNKFMMSNGFYVIDQIKIINKPYPTINGGSFGDALYINKRLLNSKQIIYGVVKYFIRNNIIYDFYYYSKKRIIQHLKKLLGL